MKNKGYMAAICITVWAITIMTFFPHSTTNAQSGNIHHDSTFHIRLKAVQGLHYDVVRFKVKPGANVKVTLVNTDDMDHNLVFTMPGKRKDVLESALQLGAKGPEMHYIPASPDVLWHIATLKPGDTQTIAFTAPRKKGAYPYVCTYPGHGATMYGVMYITDKPLPPLEDDPNVPDDSKKQKSAHRHEPGEQQLHPYAVKPPYLVRTFMPECGPAAIAVSLPDSLSYCWDAGTCCLRYAWSGAFMSKVDLWQRKGDEVAQIGGHLFFKRETDYPLRIGNEKNIPRIKFKGYTLINGYPEFHYQLDGLDVYELIKSKAGGAGIDCYFRIPHTDKQVEFIIRPSNKAIIHTSAGKWKNNSTLQLSAEEARHFTISIMKKYTLPL
jgi:azurin